MGNQRLAAGIGFCALLLGTAELANGQPLGTFRWRYAPFCNVVTLSVVQQGSVFVLSGFDDNCGNGNASSATGTAFFNPNGGVGIGLTTIAAGGTNVSSSIEISLASLSGTWSDSQSNSGNFAFSPALPAPGSARPTASGPPGLTRILQGTAVTLEPRRCYAVFAVLFNPTNPSDPGRLVAGFIRSSGGQAIVDNLFVMLPGTVNLTTQGGGVGYVIGCNLSSSPQSLPAGWQLVTKTFALP